MMTSNKKLSFILLFLFISFGTIWAQVPEAMNYQGVLRDSNDDIQANETVDVRFTILSGGSSVFSETHSGVSTNDFGLINLKVGTQNPGAFSSINWGSGTKELQVEVDAGNGFENLGSSELLSVPFALRAGTAPAMSMDLDDLGDVNAASPSSGEVLKWNGSVWAPANDIGGGTGDDWGNQVVQTDATLTGDGITGNTLGLAQQGAANNEVLKWNGSSWAPAADATGSGSLWNQSGNDINYNNGDVFIGRTSGISSAEVFGITGQASSGSYTGMYIEGSDGGSWPFYGYATNGISNMWTYYDGSTSKWHVYNSADRLTVQANGNVGIGTTSPTDKLTVEGGDIRVDGSNNFVSIYNNSTTSSSGYRLYGNSGTFEGGLFYNPSNDVIHMTRTLNEDGVYINNNYQIGLGNDQPGEDVEIGDADNSGTTVLKVGDSQGDFIEIGTAEEISDGGINTLEITNADVIPDNDNARDIGSPATAWQDIYSNNGVTVTSDINAKKDIRKLDYGLSEIMALNPISYKLKNSREGSKPTLGLIAQEVNKVISEVVKTHDWVRKDETGDVAYEEVERLGINYSALVPVLIKSIQEQQAEIKDLRQNQQDVQQLQNELQTLKAEIQDLKKQ